MMKIHYDQYKYLSVQKNNGIAIITMNRPEQRNAFPPDGLLELERIWLDIARDEEVNAIVLTGAGKAFSAGGDLRAMMNDLGTAESYSHTLNVPAGAKRLLQNILDVPQPIIAAVNGDAIGLGATLALFADTSVIAEDAKFGDTHVKVGLVAGDGGTVIWPLLIGPNRAKDFLMMSRLASGVECVEMGLMNYSVPCEQVMSRALEVARILADSAPWAVRWTKMSINQGIKAQLNMLFDAAVAYEVLTMNSADHAEAVRAMLEGRPPHFKRC